MKQHRKYSTNSRQIQGLKGNVLKNHLKTDRDLEYNYYWQNKIKKNKKKRLKPLPNHTDLYYCLAVEKNIRSNEIYAIHGRKFDDESLKAYFSQFDWCHPTIEPEDFEESMLNSYEAAEIVRPEDLIELYTTDTVHVRTEPNTDSESVIVLDNRTIVQGISEQDGWWEIYI